MEIKTMNKPNCYECKWRGNLIGDSHSCCNHPKLNNITLDNELYKILNIKGSKYGIKNHWFSWPVNFDPIWLDSCDGFTKKEGNVFESTKLDSIAK